jgi:hypothetical protein
MKRLLLSLPILTVCLTQQVRADAVIVFNEIMYHPATNEPAMEWVELRNALAVDVDISDWSITGGIGYTFASNTIVRGRGFLVVAVSPGVFTAATGVTNVLGPFTGRLGNNGDTLRLRNNSGRVMDEVSYGTDGDWPVAPDGAGVSLAKRDPDSASGPARNWAASEQMGGTPGAQNFAPTGGFVAPPGLVSYWHFNEPSGPNVGDQAGANHGVLGSGVARVGSSIGGALSFDGASNDFVNVGAGTSFNVNNGITIEAVLMPGWNSTNSAVIFRKAPSRPTNYLGAVLASQPVAYWRLSDSTTTIADSTANNRNGTATAGVQLNQPGLIASDPANTAARFTGTERVTVNGFEKIGAAGYSVEYWVRPHVLPVGCCQNLVGDGEAAGDYFMMNYILGPAQGLTGAIRPHFGPANSPVSLSGTTALQVNNTYHIVTTWDTSQAANNAVIYINGVADTVGTITRTVPAAGTTGNNRVYIGKDDRDTSDGTETIDEVALYNRPLSAADIAAHYVAGTTVDFDANKGNAVQLALQNDGNNAAANPPVAAGPVLSFGITVGGTYSELDMPLDGASGRPSLAGLEDGQPHHVVATYDSATGLKAIYVDGTLRFSATLAGPLNTANLATAVLGNSGTNGNAAFVGTLDEMAYWGRALSAAEVAAHSSAVQAGRSYFAPDPQGGAATLSFNEVSASTNAVFWLELANYGTNPIPLAGFVIRRDGVVDNEYVFPAGPSIPAGGFLAVSNSTLGFLPADGDRLFLLPPTRNTVIDSIVLTKGPRARSVAGTGPWLRPNVTTPGAANSFALRNEIVINEIMYNHALLPPLTSNSPPRSSPESWIELYNRSGSAVDLAGWELSGGISYLFTPGQMIPAGGYLVVADDVPYLRALHPGINIVGDFGGKLSGKSDHVVLKDPTGNPADEVRYFDGGRWPEYADGGGSSLELRDPNSDNSKAEAWAASDETSKTSWQTYSYRMVANIPAGSGQPTQWQDFILGLQDIGECLIDDLSVVESPTNNPVEIISNGNFDSGLSGWRVLGTHGASRVEPEPGNPGNSVLHLIATGYQEHMHNHIERTLNSGRTITSGREYQISYRARWLAGNNLLNTRLYFNRSARTIALPMPALNGTPGAQNSRFAANVGPTFSNFGHQRVAPQPGEPVTVSVVAQDPQGVASVQVFWSVNGGAWANAAMTSQGGGAYTGNIPGQSAGAVVQFYVRAVDGLGAEAVYPARGTNSGALFKVNDGQANLPLAHNVRIIVTPANIDLLHGTAQGVNQTNVMSNDLLPCTVVYDEGRAYYDCGVHLRGSQRGRYSDIRTGFHIEFPPDDLFRGVHPVMLIDRSGAGDTAANRQEEIILKHILNRAGGIPGTYGEICHLLSPRAAHVGAAQFFPRHEDNFVATAFENGSDGVMFEMELIYYPTTANAAGYKNPQPDAVSGMDVADFGNDKEIYRYNHMIKNHRAEDDYRQFIALGKAWSHGGAVLDTETRELMDIDEWMRAYALISLCSVGDMYTFGNNHNFFMYIRPSDGKFLYFPWDMDFSLNRGETASLVGDQNLGKIVSLPGNLRLLYAHMLDIINVSFNSAYMTYWVNHYETFAPGQDYTPRAAYIQNRAVYARNTINAQAGTTFTVNGSSSITTNNNLIILTGTAPAQVKTIWINGVEYPVTWTSVSAWRLLLSLKDATNVLNLVGHDIYDRPLTNFSRTITVNYTGPDPDPTGVVVINEIMYNPSIPDAAFLEVFNTSPTQSFNLAGWRINGLDYTFPKGSVITNRQYLVLAGNIPAYFAAYGTNATVPFGQFGGNLQNDGETLTLLRPGAMAGQEIVVDKVRYEGVLPWPTAPNGTGPSLQLVDPAQDHSRVGNWSEGAGWRYFTFTGTIQGGASPGTNLLVFLNSAGDVYLDDIVLVTGTEAGSGPNLITNGSFESPLSNGWELLGNHTNSVVSTDVSHSGNASMHLISSGPGGSSATLRQFIPALPTSTVCTLSYWFLPSATASNLTMRTTPGSAFASVNTVRPIFSSPGAANAAAAVLPPFPPLWLNEAQPENLTGITDNQGEREPWIELHNAGTGVVSLAGCYLADNYTNITQWPFPPGASLQPGEFKIIFADGEPGESTAGAWHTSFRLVAGSGQIALAWSPGGGTPQVLDYLTYTNIAPNRSYGDFPDAQPFDRQEFYRVTPSGTNDNVAPPIVAYINEWMAANTSSLLNTNNGNRFDDWIELYNPGATPANLAGYFLTDNLANKTQFEIPPGYVIPPHGFLLVWADNRPNLNTNTDSALHVNFALSQDGDSIGLFASDGTAIDTVDFRTEPQFNNISEGRFPDGPTTNYFLATPTPLAPNSIWANRYPVLAPIPNASLVGGETLAFTATATDPDLPPQLFTYSLAAGAPTNATINATNGMFSWTPSTSQTPSTNLITVRVTDSGFPALIAARTFQATVVAGFRISSIAHQPNGDIVLSIGATVGKTYRVEYKNDLNAANWTQLGTDQVATVTPLVIIDNLGGSPQRFYRVTQLD